MAGLKLEVGFQGKPEGRSRLVLSMCKEETTPPPAVRDRPAVPIIQAFHMWLVSGAHAGT